MSAGRGVVRVDLIAVGCAVESLCVGGYGEVDSIARNAEHGYRSIYRINAGND